ncbi:hypothetical protein SDC9_79402 [bioreactor metagenome]|uniref:Uncharacterized protein n=1 Tax=bioreactor metagenome TaxID=1076179 RepID=A0A644YWC1_9ZZZZ
MQKIKRNKKTEEDKSFLIMYCIGNIMLSVLYILPLRVDRTEFYNVICATISVILLLNTTAYVIGKFLKVYRYSDIDMLAISTFLNVSALYFITVHYVFRPKVTGSLYIYIICIAYSLGSRLVFKKKFLECLENVNLLFIKSDAIFSSSIFIIYFLLSLTVFKTVEFRVNLKLLVTHAALLVGCSVITSAFISGYFKKKYNINFKNKAT